MDTSKVCCWVIVRRHSGMIWLSFCSNFWQLMFNIFIPDTKNNWQDTLVWQPVLKPSLLQLFQSRKNSLVSSFGLSHVCLKFLTPAGWSWFHLSQSQWGASYLFHNIRCYQLFYFCGDFCGRLFAQIDIGFLNPLISRLHGNHLNLNFTHISPCGWTTLH